jgi:FkbH-like protein
VKTVKCLVWDLDDTMWDGVVLEGDDPVPFPAAMATLNTLDQRGILHAAASRGEPEIASAHLAKHDLAEMFVVLQVNWGAKSESVRRVAEVLNIGLDTIAFIDNDPLEREEVASALPMVRCYSADEAGRLPSLAEFQPEVRTAEARERRTMYRVEAARRDAETQHKGPSAEFLASLDLQMTVREATAENLARAHELTVRTHQLNTTGWTADMDELRRLCESPAHEVLVADLTDRFGPYGTIGLALSTVTPSESVMKLLLMSCRVMSRGVGTVLLDHVVGRALAAGRQPMAEFVRTDVNRSMLVTLRFGGFEVAEHTGDRMLLRYASDHAPKPANHVKLLC